MDTLGKTIAKYRKELLARNLAGIEQLMLEFSYKEISDILDMKETHVKTYLQRARNSFKKIWEEKQHGQ